MNIYKPYEVLTNSKDCLHLKENEVRERMHFALRRVLPIFLLFFTWFVLQQTGPQIPMGWNYLLIAIVLLISGLLFFKSYTTEIKITAAEIYLLQKNITGTKEISIAVNEVEKITLKRRRGKTPGAFFKLHTKEKKTYPLLSIPGIMIDEHRISMICENLQLLLHVEVEQNKRKH